MMILLSCQRSKYSSHLMSASPDVLKRGKNSTDSLQEICETNWLRKEKLCDGKSLRKRNVSSFSDQNGIDYQVLEL